MEAESLGAQSHNFAAVRGHRYAWPGRGRSAGGDRFERVADYIRKDQANKAGPIRQTHQPPAFDLIQAAAQEVDLVDGAPSPAKRR